MKTRQATRIHSRAANRNGRASGAITQRFGTVKPIANSLPESARLATAKALNQLLADSLVLRDLYKKHHWQVSGPTFHQLHLLYDKHFEQQNELIDALAERVQAMGGVAVAMANHVTEDTQIPAAPRDREHPRAQIERLLEAHQIMLKFAHEQAAKAGERGDDGTNDFLAGEFVRSHEMQVWFLQEHLEPG